MPEGPTIVILRDAVSPFEGKKVVKVSGNAKIDLDRLTGEKIIAFKSWGKHFLICFKGFSLRIHFLMFGSYTINAAKTGRAIRLQLKFRQGELNFYTCSVKYLEGDINDHYDWSGDVMNKKWNAAAARNKLKLRPELMVCDALLEQDIFAGVGNIIKNEVLYRIKVHPESLAGELTAPKRKQMIDEARIYSFQFLDWKRNDELKKHWLAHTKKTCVRCKLPLIKKYTGVKKRRSFFCENCQTLYA